MFQPVLDLSGGMTMVVTDLHGDRDAFDRCLDLFHTWRARGDVQRLMFLGDLIHGYHDVADDAGLDLILDLIALRDDLGSDSVVVVLGNHEMPHIYGVTLSKGQVDLTPRFEHALGSHREQVLTFFESLPFFVRSEAGVLFSHAGPSAEAATNTKALFQYNHQTILKEADFIIGLEPDLPALYKQYKAIFGVPYQEMAYRNLAISGPDDPRYPHLLRAFLIAQQNKEFRILWDVLFTQNETGLSVEDYQKICRKLLRAFSVDAPARQQVFVSGHIAVRGGHKIVNPYHLRFASAAHAHPREAGQILLVDLAAPVRSAQQLVAGLRNLFDCDPSSV